MEENPEGRIVLKKGSWIGLGVIVIAGVVFWKWRSIVDYLFPTPGVKVTLESIDEEES